MSRYITKIQHGLCVPIYLYQANKLKRETPRLSEATPLNNKDRRGIQPHSLGDAVPFQLMLIGDSSACGVGVATQQQALIGQLLTCLSDSEFKDGLAHPIHWQLHATSGHDSFDVLRRLYTLPASAIPIDCVLVVVGVNDVSKMQSTKQWLNNLTEVITIIEHKYHAKQILFTGIPPMHLFPAMPYPLANLIADKAYQLDTSLQQLCDQYAHVDYVGFSLAIDKIPKQQRAEYFASDGFHPSELTYALWAKAISIYI